MVLGCEVYCAFVVRVVEDGREIYIGSWMDRPGYGRYGKVEGDLCPYCGSRAVPVEQTEVTGMGYR